MGTELIEKKISKDLLLDFLKQSNAGLTESETAMFCSVAIAQNLDPFKREIYAVAYGDGRQRKLSIITGYEVYLKRAQATGLLDGFSVRINGKFKPGKFDGTREPDGDVSATCTIWIKNRSHPFEWTVAFEEYTQHNRMWASKPETMIKKVCIEQAFRLAFAGEMGGLPYAVEELPDKMTVPEIQNVNIINDHQHNETKPSAPVAPKPAPHSAQTNAPMPPEKKSVSAGLKKFCDAIREIEDGIPDDPARANRNVAMKDLGIKRLPDTPPELYDKFCARLQVLSSEWREKNAQTNQQETK